MDIHVPSPTLVQLTAGERILLVKLGDGTTNWRSTPGLVRGLSSGVAGIVASGDASLHQKWAYLCGYGVGRCVLLGIPAWKGSWGMDRLLPDRRRQLQSED
ncbi:MAG: hypothetical protein RMJ48_01675 [Roseiflexaceae bacterium]|nr:hypothetical protein [Roseiflexaceae bacterium]